MRRQAGASCEPGGSGGVVDRLHGHEVGGEVALKLGHDQPTVRAETEDVESVRVAAVLGEPLVELTRDDKDVVAEYLRVGEHPLLQVLALSQPSGLQSRDFHRLGARLVLGRPTHRSSRCSFQRRSFFHHVVIRMPSGQLALERGRQHRSPKALPSPLNSADAVCQAVSGVDSRRAWKVALPAQREAVLRGGTPSVLFRLRLLVRPAATRRWRCSHARKGC